MTENRSADSTGLRLRPRFIAGVCLALACVSAASGQNAPGGMLTPGQPARFRLGPLNDLDITDLLRGGKLYNGNFSYRLQVPTNASRVTLSLDYPDSTSLRTAVAIDMHVNFGRDVEGDTVGDIIIGTDHSAYAALNQRELVINRSSDPPLRAGTYYVALLLYPTLAAITSPVEGTLTATIETVAPPQPSFSGGPLTPGQPAPFRLGPRDLDTPYSRTIYIRNNSFRLEVPANAAGVTFILNSANPDVNTDLFVRFEEDNYVQDGRIVSDYSSATASGNERIVITRSSDPPLRSGTYYVSLALSDKGIVAEGTLTAIIETGAAPPPPIGGVPLTPRPPANFRLFRLGPVDNPRLFRGNYSYWLEVPEDASRVTFALNSADPADPDVNVDLHVRFGEDNVVRDGRVVSDYSSETASGNERIVITRSSDPPLRAGTYYVSLALLDTGVVATGTLTATIEQPRISGGPLTPGQPAPFRLEPRDLDTPYSIFIYTRNNSSFRLEVPANAAGVTFILNSATPDVNTDLFVRFGEDNDVQDRRIVSDYSSRTASGNERIVITRSSDPPLRSGTYYVSLALSDKGFVAEGTIAAYLDQDSSAGGPLISSGGIVPATGTPIVHRISPNALVSIFGQNFAPQGTRTLSPRLDAAGRIAANLAETCLEIDGRRAPLLIVTPGQINAQAPHDLSPGQTRATVVRGCGTSNEIRGAAATVTVGAVSPAFFNFKSNPDGNNPVVAHGSGPGFFGAPGLLPGAEFTPAEPGEVVTLYGTGFGATDPPLEAGRIPGAAANLANAVSFTVGGIAVPPEDVYYAGAAPCCAGLYQFTLRLPPAVADGDAAVAATVNGVSTPQGPFLTVRRRGQ